jgi:hypothetical protein
MPSLTLACPGYVGGGGLLKIDTEFASTSPEDGRYTIREIEYTFHGWAMRE